MGDRRCGEINTSDGNLIVRSISGLVVEYIVAIDVTRVRFSADAYEFLYPISLPTAANEQHNDNDAGRAEGQWLLGGRHGQSRIGGARASPRPMPTGRKACLFVHQQVL
jgi:hypothetical protein